MADTFNITLTEDTITIDLNDGVPMTWGYIQGTLSSQLDLLAALALKQNSQPTIITITANTDTTIPNTADIIRIRGNGHIALTACPTIQPGRFDGQIMRIFGQDDNNLITLQDQANYFGTTLHLPHAQNVALGKNDNITFTWNLTQTAWIACGSVIDTY